MAFARLDDAFPDHAKTEGLSDAAFRLHVSGICFCTRLLTDGLVPGDRASRLVPRFRGRSLAELVAAGVWHPDGHDCGRCPQPGPGNFWVHDLLEWNRSRAEVEQDRAAAADRQQKWRESRRDKRRDSQRSNTVTNGVTNGVTHGVSNAVSNASHSTPLHSPPSGEWGGAPPDPPCGAGCESGWVLDPDGVATPCPSCRGAA